jgi:hypothetical protein
MDNTSLAAVAKGAPVSGTEIMRTEFLDGDGI